MSTSSNIEKIKTKHAKKGKTSLATWTNPEVYDALGILSSIQGISAFEVYGMSVVLNSLDSKSIFAIREEKAKLRSCIRTKECKITSSRWEEIEAVFAACTKYDRSMSELIHLILSAHAKEGASRWGCDSISEFLLLMRSNTPLEFWKIKEKVLLRA